VLAPSTPTEPITPSGPNEPVVTAPPGGKPTPFPPLAAPPVPQLPWTPGPTPPSAVPLPAPVPNGEASRNPKGGIHLADNRRNFHPRRLTDTGVNSRTWTVVAVTTVVIGTALAVSPKPRTLRKAQ
jgi:hypothetical protein